jgi:hypothetical protein
MDDPRESPVFKMPRASDVPSLAELMDRGDAASQAMRNAIEESRQLRQSLLYNVASNTRSIRAMSHGAQIVAKASSA